MKENSQPDEEMNKAETELGWMVNSPIEGFNGLYGDDAKSAVVQALEREGHGNQTINWKIRPWLISRQRYWGTPIPVIHCSECGAVPVPEDQLPVELPRNVVFGEGNPLSSCEEFVNVKCPKCGLDARRETDTMDTFVDSSWYFMRYTDAQNNSKCFSEDIVNHWMNVDFYCGGIEHAQMHLIYARFWTKALRDLGLHSIDEPFNELLCQGMVNKQAPWCDSCSITLPVEYIGKSCPQCSDELGLRSAKMSKSLGNTVSPEDMIEKFGADTVRLFILFAANPTAGMDWSDTALEANHRVMLQLLTIPNQILSWGNEQNNIDLWLEARMKQRVEEFQTSMDNYDLRRAVEISHYELIKDMNWYIRRGGNNCDLGKQLLSMWSHLLSVSTPHLAEEWWRKIGNDSLISNTVFTPLEQLTAKEQVELDNEYVMRNILENARKVKSIAERHLNGPAKKLTLTISPEWKRKLAKMAIEYVDQGGNVKAFMSKLKDSELASLENSGEIFGFWGKKMLPQIFKWDDKSKLLISGDMDELQLLSQRKEFIKMELGLDEVSVISSEESTDDSGRINSAMPLSPAVIYA
jgi:leucyl-tRNA synthetase